MSDASLLRIVLPEIVLLAMALLVLTLDLTWFARLPLARRFTLCSALSCCGCLLAAWSLPGARQPLAYMDGLLLASPLTYLVQNVILALAALALLLCVGRSFSEHVGEYALLILFAATGMLLLVATNDLLTFFLSLELLSLSLYVLTAFDKSRPSATEAALKYFLFGAVTAAFLLFGLSLLYGLANSTRMPAVALAIQADNLSPLAVIAMLAAIVGLSFKVAAAPLHFWAPDVYQAAPTPSAALIASASKVAGFFVFFRLMTVAFPYAAGGIGPHPIRGWMPAVAAIAGVSMLLGNLTALAQSSLSRLIAYSAVAHAGYMLVALCAHTPAAEAALLYYVFTYALTALGLFAVLAALPPEMDRIAALAGLHRRAPALSLAMGALLLSLAGIPPFAGFFAKFYLFAAVYRASPALLPLVLLAVAMSAVSLYYYLRVMKVAVAKEPELDAAPLPYEPVATALALALAALVALLGLFPEPLVRSIQMAIAASS